MCGSGRQDATAARRGDRGRDPSGPRRGAREGEPARTSASSTRRAGARRAGFDRALVDAPCSGLGVLARRPDLRWRAHPLPELQLELLRRRRSARSRAATIVYSVCTLNADENEAVVDASGLEPEPLGEEWPQYAHPKRPEFLLTRPDRDRTSGFFIARLQVVIIDVVGWSDWIARASKSSRRCTAPTSRGSASRSTRCSTRAAASSTSTSATATSSSR